MKKRIKIPEAVRIISSAPPGRNCTEKILFKWPELKLCTFSPFMFHKKTCISSEPLANKLKYFKISIGKEKNEIKRKKEKKNYKQLLSSLNNIYIYTFGYTLIYTFIQGLWYIIYNKQEAYKSYYN